MKTYKEYLTEKVKINSDKEKEEVAKILKVETKDMWFRNTKKDLFIYIHFGLNKLPKTFPKKIETTDHYWTYDSGYSGTNFLVYRLDDKKRKLELIKNL